MRTAVVALLSGAVILGVAGCSSSAAAALAPAEDARAALATSDLAWDQFERGATLPATSTVTLEDMLAALAESESTLVELPAAGGATRRALDAVRATSDVVADALEAARGDRPDEGVADELEVAAAELDDVIAELEAAG